MQIFGLDPLIAAILITVAGVSLSVLLGWLKGSEPINPKQITASALIAFVFSIQLVIAEITILPEDLEQLALGTIMFGLLAQVSGIDSLAKSAAKAVLKVKKG